MTWPEPEQIKEAILQPENIADGFTVAHNFRCCASRRRGRILPLSSEGGFCVAFQFANDAGEELCYRVWHKEPLHDMQHRLRLISDFLAQNRLPYFVDFSFLSDALHLPGGERVPGVRMAWVKGQTLSDFIREHAREQSAMHRLADQFMAMCQTFRRLGIAHGDLSNDNILIDGQQQIRLVDYDSVYVPQMGTSFMQTTGGFVSFQHPWRISHSARLKASAADDNFSQQVIYLSLLGVIKKPETADIFGEKDLLFNAADYQSEAAFVQSRGYQRLDGIHDTEIQRRLAELRRSVAGDYASIRSICDRPEPVHVVEYARFCLRCGEPFRPDARFCPKCGHQRDIVKSHYI